MGTFGPIPSHTKMYQTQTEREICRFMIIVIYVWIIIGFVIGMAHEMANYGMPKIKIRVHSDSIIIIQEIHQKTNIWQIRNAQSAGTKMFRLRKDAEGVTSTNAQHRNWVIYSIYAKRVDIRSHKIQRTVLCIPSHELNTFRHLFSLHGLYKLAMKLIMFNFSMFNAHMDDTCGGFLRHNKLFIATISTARANLKVIKNKRIIIDGGDASCS